MTMRRYSYASLLFDRCGNVVFQLNELIMTVRVSLFLRATSNEKILIKASHYTSNMTNNALFSAADIVAQVEATVIATDNLDAAMNQSLSETKMANIKVCRGILDKHLIILAGKVEAVANDPNLPDLERVVVVSAAGMELKPKTLPKKRVFTAVNGPISGTVYLIAAGGDIVHEWQFSEYAPDFTNRTSAPLTLVANTKITGLTSLKTYAFFHRGTVRGHKTEWEGPIFLLVL